VQSKKFKVRVGYALCSIGIASAVVAAFVDFSPLRWLWALLIGAGLTLLGVADYIEPLEGASIGSIQALKRAPKKLKAGLGLLYLGLFFGALYCCTDLLIPPWIWGPLIGAGLTMVSLALEEKHLERVHPVSFKDIVDPFEIEKQPKRSEAGEEAEVEAEIEAAIEHLRETWEQTSKKDKPKDKAR